MDNYVDAMPRMCGQEWKHISISSKIISENIPQKFVNT